jgi:hypothetical protein
MLVDAVAKHRLPVALGRHSDNVGKPQEMVLGSACAPLLTACDDPHAPAWTMVLSQMSEFGQTIDRVIDDARVEPTPEICGSRASQMLDVNRIIGTALIVGLLDQLADVLCERGRR